MNGTLQKSDQQGWIMTQEHAEILQYSKSVDADLGNFSSALSA